jgi:hypothetical protein
MVHDDGGRLCDFLALHAESIVDERGSGEVDPSVSENKGMRAIGMQAAEIGAKMAVVACGNASVRDPRGSDTTESRRACGLRQRRRN